jgi:Cu/Ag efflux pump CusA
MSKRMSFSATPNPPQQIKEGKMNSWKDLAEAIDEGVVQKVRPKMMTVMTMVLGLVPLLRSHGTGADVMKRIAAPMVGGLVISNPDKQCTCHSEPKAKNL